MVRKSLFQINLTNRGVYTLIVLGILSLIGVSVLALQPGVAPNPGHLLSEVSPPSPCTSGQVIGWDGTNLVCVDTAQGGGITGVGAIANFIPLWISGTSLGNSVISQDASGNVGLAGNLEVDGDVTIPYTQTLYDTNTLTSCSQNNPPNQAPSTSNFGIQNGCTCLTGLQPNSPTCTYNSFMSGGNNYASCVYSCSTKKVVSNNKYSLKQLFTAPAPNTQGEWCGYSCDTVNKPCKGVNLPNCPSGYSITTVSSCNNGYSNLPGKTCIKN